MNYHVLPCGTPIPPEGIEAWVKNYEGENWRKKIIVSFVGNSVIVANNNRTSEFRYYFLADPTNTKGRWVTPMELLGKILHTDHRSSLVIEVEDGVVYTKNHSYTVDYLAKHNFGYSDTPTSEVKSFWVEEV